MPAKPYNGLYPFKGWSTIEEASLILSEAMGTKISSLDVHNLVAKGSLKLHLYLPKGVEVVGLKKIDPEDYLFKVVSKRGCYGFWRNPSWEPMDDLAKEVSGTYTLLQVKQKYPELYDAIRADKYWIQRTDDSIPLVENSINPDYYVANTAEVIYLPGDSCVEIHPYFALRMATAERRKHHGVEYRADKIINGVGLVAINEQVMAFAEGPWAGCEERRRSLLKATNVFPKGSFSVLTNESIQSFLEQSNDGGVIKSESVSDTVNEALGLLIEAYASKLGPSRKNGEKPNISRIVEDMRELVDDDMTKMSKRKLQELLGQASKAWQMKKSR